MLDANKVRLVMELRQQGIPQGVHPRPTRPAPPMPQQLPYQLTFGKYNEKTLEQCPESYVKWLIDHRIYDNYPMLKVELVRKNRIPANVPEAAASSSTAANEFPRA